MPIHKSEKQEALLALLRMTVLLQTPAQHQAALEMSDRRNELLGDTAQRNSRASCGSKLAC